jgi:hypothetical protein
MEDRGILKLAPTHRGLLAALSVLVFSLVAACVAAELAEADGPWRAQVIDADTGTPLPGVVVLALWRKKSPGLIHPDDRFFDVDETITDTNGQFTIPARDTTTQFPGTRIVGPDIRMFKGGYGQWRFRETATEYPLLRDAIVAQQLSKEQWEKFVAGGVVIQLPQLTTREIRRRALEQLSGPFREIPAERIPLWIDAYSRERVSLGLDPYPDKFGGGARR